MNALLIDDHDAARTFLAASLRARFHLEIRESKSGVDALQLLAITQFDLIVLDTSFDRIAEQNGLCCYSLVKKMRELAPNSIFFVYTHADSPVLLEAIRHHVNGIALKSDNIADVIGLISQCTELKETSELSNVFFAPKHITSMFKELKRMQICLSDFSDNEKIVLKGIAHGLSNKEISINLGRCISTVETTRKKIRERLEVITNHELAIRVTELKYKYLLNDLENYLENYG
jgi:DNA-binding NarL/FixJ family response regulator